jgi:hypothetical protein
MLAAEHLATSDLASEGFDAKLRASAAMAELRKVRNIKPGFKRGLWFGMLNAAWETITGGLSPWTLKNKADWSSLFKIGEHESPKRDYIDRTLAPRDRLAGVYFATTEHDEDQPVHLRVLDTTSASRGAPRNTTTRARASARRRVRDRRRSRWPGEHGKRLQINAANCVHCKTCDIRTRTKIITWVHAGRRFGAELPEPLTQKEKGRTPWGARPLFSPLSHQPPMYQGKPSEVIGCCVLATPPSQIALRPVLMLRHWMSSRPSPLKSPAPTIVQSSPMLGTYCCVAALPPTRSRCAPC